MRLLVRRDQRAGMLGGKPVFSLDARAEMSAEEQKALQTYKLGSTVLFELKPVLTITVADLAQGKRIECKDILEMLAKEREIIEAAQKFKRIMDACLQFGGEEAIELE